MGRILIIEDEVAIADLEKDYLELSGFDVEIENAGDSGLKRALKEIHALGGDYVGVLLGRNDEKEFRSIV